MSEEEGFLFDGNADMRAKLERGQSFGLSTQQYHAVVTCSLSAERYAGIQPAEIRRLPDNEPGCQLTLWGKSLAYIVRFKPGIHFLALSVEPMDASESETLVLSFNDDALAWSRVINAMIKFEGLAPGWRPVTYEDVAQRKSLPSVLGVLCLRGKGLRYHTLRT